MPQVVPNPFRAHPSPTTNRALMDVVEAQLKGYDLLQRVRIHGGAGSGLGLAPPDPGHEGWGGGEEEGIDGRECEVRKTWRGPRAPLSPSTLP